PLSREIKPNLLQNYQSNFKLDLDLARIRN
ncbi:MAG: hypothetical protein ACI85H_001150, partial [Paracoccaceae bacterium]